MAGTYEAATPDVDRHLFKRVREEVGSRIAMADLSADEVERMILEETRRALRGGGAEAEALARAIGDDFLRYGPLQPLIEDDAVSEIMVTGGGRDPETGAYGAPRVFVEVAGVNYSCPAVSFDDEEHLTSVVNRIGRAANRRCDDANPMMDAQLPDGSRVNAVHHSVAIDGQTLNIRKFRKGSMTPADLVEAGACTAGMMDFLRSCVLARVSIIVSGGTGSGKTTMLNALSCFIPENEHIVVAEDTAELKLLHPHVDRLQARPANAEGNGKVDLHDLVVNALRMKPDRIVVGECRSTEAVEMLQAMQTGHDGSLTTVHANSATGVFKRIEAMVSGTQGVAAESVKQQIASAVDLIVHTRRLRSGRRIVEEVVAVDKYSDGVIGHTGLFRANVAPDAEGVEFDAAGIQPHAIKKRITDAGIEYKPEWFFGEGAY